MRPFTRELVEWEPPNLCAIMQSEMIVGKVRDLLRLNTDEEILGRNEPPEVKAVITKFVEQRRPELKESHSRLCREMQLKLLNIRRENLAEAAQWLEEDARWKEPVSTKDRLERSSQRVAEISGQLQRAELHYFRLQEQLGGGE